MRNQHPKYQCFPAVVCVGKETVITLFPRDLSRRFREEKEYELCILGLRDFEETYHSPAVYDYPFTVQDGCLCFTVNFDREQEYELRVREKDTKETRIPLYAVKEDLFGLRPLKGDLHTHTYYSDGQDGITNTPADYREEGFDFVSITDHNRMFTSRLAAELYHGVPLGMHIMSGEEVHTPGSTLHIIHAGGKHSVCEQYIHHPEEFEAAVDAVEQTLTHVPELYRRRTAMAKWACDEIRKAEGLAVLAHPFWKCRCYNVSEEFADILFHEKMFDAFELLNGIGTEYNNLQVALWQEQKEKGNALPIVGSSDSHNHDFAHSTFGRRFTVVFAKENTTEAILEAIRQGYSVAGELPASSGEEVRFYGALRLVLFAHFLFRTYFAETERLCFGEGVLMRRYAEGEAVGEVLAGLAGTVEHYYRKFYGQIPAQKLSQDQSAFLDRCLTQQRTLGPCTKGSLIYTQGENTRRE